MNNKQKSSNDFNIDILNRIERKIDLLDADIKNIAKDLNNRIWNNFLWQLTTSIALYTGLIYIIGHANKWF